VYVIFSNLHRFAICVQLGREQVKKLQDRLSKCKEDVQRTREKYDTALHEITAYNPKYIEDMREVFDKCQEMEAKRLKFFKDIMFVIHKCVNISEKPAYVLFLFFIRFLIFGFQFFPDSYFSVSSLPQIYEEFLHTITNADQAKDLKWWSNNHGVNMAMNWPTFEVINLVFLIFLSYLLF